MKKSVYFFVLEILLYAISGISLFTWSEFMIYVIGSTDSYMLSYLPFILLTLLPSFLLLFVHLYWYAHSFFARKLMTTTFGVFFASYGLLMALLPIVFLANKTYPSVVMGNATALYPLDSIILGVILLFIGVSLVIYARKKMKEESFVSVEEKPGKAWGIVRGILTFLFTYISAWWFGDLIFALLAADYGNNVFISLVMYLLFAHPAVMLLLYQAFYRKKKSRRFWFVSAISTFSASALLIASFAIYKSVNGMQFVTESLTYAFPLDFATSKNFGPIVLILMNAVAPIVSLAMYFLSKSKKEEELEQKEEEESK